MRYLLISLLAVCSLQAGACDVCGGSGGSYLGILPGYQQHFIGLSFQYQQFNATHPQMAGETTAVRSQNYVRSLTAWGRFYPLRRLQVFAFLPYTYNTAVEPSQVVNMQGIGDIKVLANYMLLNTSDSSNRKLKHTLLAGGGVKVPTGKNSFVNSEGIILSNMEPGTGSWDFIANANYTIGSGKIGVNADASYKHSTTNKRGYRYGDKVNTSLMAFYKQELGNITLLPQAGMRYEHSQVDYSSYYYRIHNTYSGGAQVYTAAGMSVYIKQLALSAIINIPVWQNYAGGLVQAKPRTEMQLQFLF